MKYVIRATHEDGRRFCHEAFSDYGARGAMDKFSDWLAENHGEATWKLTTIDIDRLDDEPTTPTP